MANLDIQSPPAARRLPLQVHAPRVYELHTVPSTSGATVAQEHVPAIEPVRAPPFSYRRAGKRLLDITLVLALMPVYMPLIGAAAVMLYVEGGNPFYRQERLGRNGARFSLLKLRTMVRDADAKLKKLLEEDPELKREWDVSQKLKSDPRVTRVGEFLRRTSLDELPQLWNVLTGDMSLVGPRPMMPDQLPLYGDPEPYFAVRPGITGLWQVGRRNEGSFADRAQYDTAYFRDVSLTKDLRVLWQTIGVVLRRTGC